jgi:hypothetical protein
MDFLQKVSRPPVSSHDERKASIVQQTAKSQSQVELLVAAMAVDEAVIDSHGISIHALLNSNSSRDSTSTPIFTFVRDPMTRFFLAFQDLMNRFLTMNKGKTLDSKLIQTHLKELLDFSPSLPGPSSMFPLVGLLFDFHIDLLGHFESLSADWSKIRTHYRLAPGQGKSSKAAEKGRHLDELRKGKRGKGEAAASAAAAAAAASAAQSAEPLTEADYNLSPRADPADAAKVQAALAAFLESDPHYMRALCHIFLADYVCLSEYPLPPSCQFLNDARTAAVKALEANAILPTQR